MLEVKNVSKSFNNVVVFNNISFNLEKKDRLAIIGPSGCGKSTLLRCINKLETPDNGSIVIDGIDILDKKTNLEEVRKKIGMVFQQFNLFENLTVIENVTLAPIKLGLMSEDKAKKEAIKLLKKIDMEDKANHYPNEISGGQKQRVAIIRSLIMNPEIILFDEPTSALDPEMVGEVLELIKRIANQGMTMIIVSHEMNFIKNIATKVLFLDEKKVSFYGTTEEAFKNKTNKRLQEFLTKSFK